MRIQSLQTDIEQRLATAEPDVEVLACESAGSERVRLFIDHPDGVDLALCERVTNHLRDLLADYSLEVSSPGRSVRCRSRTTSAASSAGGARAPARAAGRPQELHRGARRRQ